MLRSTIHALALSVLTISCGDESPAIPTPPAPMTPKTPIERGIAYLAARQSPDGAWRAVESGAFRDGHAMTAWVAYVAAQLPQPVPGMDRALAWLRRHIGSDGLIETPEVPIYTTALTVLAFVHFKPPQWEDDVKQMSRGLREAQFTFQERSCRGGWGNAGQFADISVTAFALEALRAAGVPDTDPIWDRAEKFVDRCANPDGGFFFTPAPMYHFKNKAGKSGGGFRSYGPATCDGLRARRAMGRPADPKWLEANRTAGEAPGYGPDVDPPFQRGLRFYWLYAQSRLLPVPDLAATLEQLQNADGSWISAHDLMNEDEPLIATGLALAALGRAQVVTKSQD